MKIWYYIAWISAGTASLPLAIEHNFYGAVWAALALLWCVIAYRKEYR